MSQPANNTWINSIWNAQRTYVARPLQRMGQWTWNKISLSKIKTEWEGSSEQTRQTVKKVAAVAAGTLTLGVAGTMATVYAPNLAGYAIEKTGLLSEESIATAMSMGGTIVNYGFNCAATAVGVGAATKEYRKFKNDSDSAAALYGVAAGSGALLLTTGATALANYTGVVPIASIAAGGAVTTYQWLKGGSMVEVLGAGAVATAGLLSNHPLGALAGGGAITAYKKLVKDEPLAEAIGSGVIATTSLLSGSQLLGTGHAMLASTIAAIPALSTGSAVAMAVNPTLSTLVPIPWERRLARFDNPNDTKTLHAEPKLTLEELTAKVGTCRLNHPPGCSWVNPEIAILKNLSELPLEAIRRGLGSVEEKLRRQLGRMPTSVEIDAAKLELVADIITDWDPSVVRSDITFSLVEKIEALPTPTPVYLAAKKETDKQLDLLEKKIATFATLFAIHCKLLGFDLTEEATETFRHIIKEFSEIKDTSASLWDLYLKYFEADLSFFQKIKARFAYFILHSLGLIPNTLKTFVSNLIGENRNFIKIDSEKLKLLFAKGLEKLTELLEVYREAPRRYVNDEEFNGTLASFKKREISKLGTRLLYEKLKDELTPEQIGKKMIAELTKELTENLVNECFPRVNFFENLKPTTLWGIRIGIVFDVLDFFLGSFLNFLVREFARYYLPESTQSLIDKGLEKTMPGQFSFKIALANSITNQVEALREDLKKPQTTKPPKKMDNALIEGMADRLIDVLKLENLGENPRKKDVEDFLKKKDEQTVLTDHEKELRAQIIDGTKLLIYFYTQKPEKIEKLIGDLFFVSNKGFEVDQAIPTEATYNQAVSSLEISTKHLIKEAVVMKVEETARGPDPKTLEAFMVGKKDLHNRVIEAGIYDTQQNKGLKSFQSLSQLCIKMIETVEGRNPEEGALLLKQLDHYAAMMEEFASHATSMEIGLYPEDVQFGFYKTFHSIYEESISLVQKVIDLRTPNPADANLASVIEYDKYLKLAHKFNEIQAVMERESLAPEALRLKIEDIEKIGSSYNSEIPFLSQFLPTLKDTTSRVELAAKEAEMERQDIDKLRQLGDPTLFTYNYLSNTKDGNEKIRKCIPQADQEAFIKLIRLLQTEFRKIPRKDIGRLRVRVEDALRQILNKHVRLKNEKIALMNQGLTEFRTVVGQVLEKTAQKREIHSAGIQVKLDSLLKDTSDLLQNLKEIKMPNLFFPAQNMPESLIKAAYDHFGQPIVDSFEPYLKSAFKLITHNDIYQGTARLLIGSVNEAFPKHSVSIPSTIFQWVARKVFSSPEESGN